MKADRSELQKATEAWQLTYASLRDTNVKLIEENNSLRLRLRNELEQLENNKEGVIRDLKNQLSENNDKHRAAIDSHQAEVCMVWYGMVYLLTLP